MKSHEYWTGFRQALELSKMEMTELSNKHGNSIASDAMRDLYAFLLRNIDIAGEEEDKCLDDMEVEHIKSHEKNTLHLSIQKCYDVEFGDMAFVVRKDGWLCGKFHTFDEAMERMDRLEIEKDSPVTTVFEKEVK